MKLNPPRVPEILVGAFAALLILSLFLPWYRADEPAGCAPGADGCVRDTQTAFEAFAVVDILAALVAIGGLALLLLEMTQDTPAVPVAWSAMLAPLTVVAFGLVLWRTVAPPEDAGDEPVFALLGLVASGGLAVATMLSMRSEGYGWRSRAADPVPSEPLPAPIGSREEGAR